jgi:DNA-binding XRE family transcriptional regulator
MEEFRITLKAARVNAGMTQAEAARAVGVKRETILHYETGRTKPKAAIIEKLCKVYGMPTKCVRID